MKYKTFYEWFNIKDYSYVSKNEKTLMQLAWDAALDSFYGAREIVKLNILRKKAAIGEQITELVNTINEAEKADYQNFLKNIPKGFITIAEAEEKLTKYIHKLRKNMK